MFFRELSDKLRLKQNISTKLYFMEGILITAEVLTYAQRDLKILTELKI